MSVNVTMTVSGKGAEVLLGIREAANDKDGLHEAIATNALRFVKNFGAEKSQSEHRTADALGAKRTGHLERAYRSIESGFDQVSARLLVPRSSRLRAAFGSYTLRPVNGSKYLTIPVHPDAYGKRAREFTNLVALRVGPKKNLILARIDGDEVETMFFLTEKVEIREDATLIPFREIGEEAVEAVEEFIANEAERRLA